MCTLAVVGSAVLLHTSLLLILLVTTSLGIATPAVQLARERDGPSKFQNLEYAIRNRTKTHSVFTHQGGNPCGAMNRLSYTHSWYSPCVSVIFLSFVLITGKWQ